MRALNMLLVGCFRKNVRMNRPSEKLADDYIYCYIHTAGSYMYYTRADAHIAH